MIDKKEIRKQINAIVETEFNKRTDETCKETYYKNRYLEYAMKEHKTLQCIIRTYCEALKTGSFLYTHNPLDLKHANYLITYINLYSNDSHLDFVNDLFLNFRKKMALEHPDLYFSGSMHGRLKSFLSLEAKLRKKLLMSETLAFILENLNDFIDFKSLEEIDFAKSVLKELQIENNREDLIRDAIGYRIIADVVNSSMEESGLIEFIYELAEYITAYFDELGHDIIDIKDFIKKPRDKYRSFHCIIGILHTPVELQLRTSKMHKEAENGIASHLKYKLEQKLYHFLNDFLNHVSENLDRVDFHKRIGLLKELNLSNRPWIYIPSIEIPKTPAELKDFADLEFLQSVFS